MSELLYIYLGLGKDTDGECRKALAKVWQGFGGEITEEASKASVIAALGGDGTIMRAAHLAVKYDIPVIGINLGRIGYMAEIDESEIPLLGKYFSKEYEEEHRMMLRVSVGGKVIYALNDAVFHSHYKHMVHYTLSCNGRPVNEYRGDGLILATPTGSTAYAMSAGGSVIDPRLSCIGVTPVCSQSITAKPLVFAPDSKLTVKAMSAECMLTVDGREPMALANGTEVTVCKSRKSLRMLRLKDDGFYQTLRNKILNYN
jgi:NAD+ kinase